MNQERSPYAVSFGKIPKKYIERDLIIDDIIEAFDCDEPQEQAYKLTGVRGSGKTVTIASIEHYFRTKDNWIVISLNSNSNLHEDLISKIYTLYPFMHSFINANFSLSFLNTTLSLDHNNNIISLSAVLGKILNELKLQGKRLLVTIDEMHKTDSTIDFVKDFQDYIKSNLPIFLIADGLYEDIEDIENTDGLTFFYRAEKFQMEPLNITLIRKDYMDTLNIPFELADEMAGITKGYAFCYQALGKYMWLSQSKELNETIFAKLDDALSEKVYKKIWSELTPKDKFFLSFIVKKESMDVSELLSVTKSRHNDFTNSRRRLTEKYILSIAQNGTIKLKLPRFKEFVERMLEE